MWLRREDWGGGYHSLDIQAPAKNSGWRADAKFLLLSRSRLWLSAALVESSPYSRTCVGCLFPILLSGPLKTADVWRRPTPTRYYSISIKREEVFEVLSNSFTNKLLQLTLVKCLDCLDYNWNYSFSFQCYVFMKRKFIFSFLCKEWYKILERVCRR